MNDPALLIAVEAMCADTEALRSGVSAAEWDYAHRLVSPRRRVEWLSWHALLRRELGRRQGSNGPDLSSAIAYDRRGAPVLEAGRGYISVSHCAGFVAVALCMHAPCGIDIERIDRDFSRALPRYLTADELAMCTDARTSAAAWCAKEALYKWLGRTGIVWKRDLRLLHIDPLRGCAEASVFGREVGVRLRTEGAVMAACVAGRVE